MFLFYSRVAKDLVLVAPSMVVFVGRKLGVLWNEDVCSVLFRFVLGPGSGCDVLRLLCALDPRVCVTHKCVSVLLSGWDRFMYVNIRERKRALGTTEVACQWP